MKDEIYVVATRYFVSSLALFVAIAELARRFTLPEGYYVWPPNFRERFALLADGMARYNQALLDICRERGVECTDTASLLPRNRVVFWDDAHLTVEGSHRLARIVADYLRSRPLSKRQPRVSLRTRQSSARLAMFSTAKVVKAT